MCLTGKDEEEWLYAWNDMIEKYDLKGNKWLKDLFAVKEKWALVYGRHTFTADMMSTQRSEKGQASVRKSGAIEQKGQILDGESVASEQKCQAFDGESGVSEHKEMIQLDDKCEITACEVKRKATIGRPHNRYKDPLERRVKPQTKATKSSIRKGTRLKDCAPFSGNSNEQQVTRHGYPMFNVLTQGSCIENGTQAPFLGLFTNSHNSIPLIQQFQEVIMHHHDLSQINSANKGIGK
ncbi:hypothetical protein ACFX2K_038075 [Malus domestica]